MNFFFAGPLHVSFMGWAVKIYMSEKRRKKKNVWLPLTGVPPRFLCKYLDFFQTIHMGGRGGGGVGTNSIYKMPPHFLSNLIRALSNLSQNIQKIANSPY